MVRFRQSSHVQAGPSTVPDADALRQAALHASWRRDRQVGRRRLAWRWMVWYFIQCRWWLLSGALACAAGVWWLLRADVQPNATQVSERVGMDSPAGSVDTGKGLSLQFVPKLKGQAAQPADAQPGKVELLNPEPALELQFDKRIYSKEI